VKMGLNGVTQEELLLRISKVSPSMEPTAVESAMSSAGNWRFKYYIMPLINQWQGFRGLIRLFKVQACMLQEIFCKRWSQSMWWTPLSHCKKLPQPLPFRSHQSDQIAASVSRQNFLPARKIITCWKFRW
jgi:hypothetical protein